MSNREGDTLKDVAMRVILRFPGKALTSAAVERADAVLPHDKEGRQYVKREVIDALIKDNRFLDETVPLSFYEKDQRRLSFKGASKYLDLSACFSLKDSALPLALCHCPSLKSLKLENCRKLTDEAFDHIIKLSKHLQALYVGGNFNMTQDGLIRLLSTHPNRANLKEFHCSGIHFTSPLLLALATHCPKLRHLGIGYNNLMTEEALKSLLRKLKLRKLHIPWCQRAVTDSLLQFLSDECDELEELSICGAKGVSAAGIEELLRKTNPPTADGSSNMDIDPPRKEGGRKRFKRLKVRYAGANRADIQAVEEGWREEVGFWN